MSDEKAPQPEREWTPVAPAHPYGSSTNTGSGPGSASFAAAPGGHGTGGAPRSRGLAIAAMAIGLAAILTAAVATFYFVDLVYVGAALGLVAIGLGITAIMKHQVPKAASITGIAAGAGALLVAAVVAGIMVGSELSREDSAQADGASQGDEGGSGADDTDTDDTGAGSDTNTDEDNRWNPDDEPEPLLQWPANAGTGGFLFEQGAEGPELLRSDPLEPNAAPTPAEVDRVNGPADILLYVDYRCPYCVDFETANAARLETLVTDGEATLEIRPMAFVSPFSLSLSSAMACVADEQPEAAWQSHLTLLDPSTQNISTVDHMISTLDRAVGGLNASAEACIAEERFAPFAESLSQWYTMSPVPNAVDPQLTVRGTPLAVVNGVPFTGHPGDQAAFEAFLMEHGL